MVMTMQSFPPSSSRARMLAADCGIASAFAVVVWAYSLSYDGGVDVDSRVVHAWQGPELVFPVLTVLLVAVRRLRPWLVLVGLFAVDWVDRWLQVSSEPFGVAMGLFTVAGLRPRRQAVIAGAVALAVLVASMPLIGRTGRGAWTCGLVYAFGWFAGIAVRTLEQSRWAMLRLVAEARAERRSAQRAQERAALALEVHDVLSNSLAVILRLSEVARRRLRSDPDSSERALDDVVRLARDGMAEVRRFVATAEPETTTDLGTLTMRMRAVGMPLTVTVEGEPRDRRLAATVHRVVQEALTNVLRHARPTRVEVVVRWAADGGVSLRVANDGVQPGGNREGRGTRGMAERIARAGGSISIGPSGAPGTWAVAAEVPGSPRIGRSEEHVDERAVTR